MPLTFESDRDHALRYRLHDWILQRIAFRIIRAHRRRLNEVLFTEARLCRQLKVSRTVVREAIKVLAGKGLVEVRPKLGIRALPRSRWHLTDAQVLGWLCAAGLDNQLILNLCEVRQILEPAAARLAATRATAREIATIQARFHRMVSVSKRSKKFVTADIQFHVAIFAACHNDLLEHMSATIRKAFRPSITVTSKVPEGLRLALEMHRTIAHAIARRDAEGAYNAMVLLLKKTSSDIRELLQLEGVCPDSAENGVSCR